MLLLFCFVKNNTVLIYLIFLFSVIPQIIPTKDGRWVVCTIHSSTKLVDKGLYVGYERLIPKGYNQLVAIATLY